MSAYNIHGINTKTFSIPVAANIYNYVLGDVILASAFKHADAIVGLFYRCDVTNQAIYRDEKEKVLVPVGVMQNSWLDLYSISGEKLLYNHNLQMLATNYVVKDSYGHLIPPNQIDWNRSNISMSPNTILTDGQQLEFTILYTTTCAKPYSPNVAFNVGSYNVPKRRTIHVKTSSTAATSSFYKFGSNSLPDCAQIVGISFAKLQYETRTGLPSVEPSTFVNPLQQNPPKEGAMDSSFLQLKTTRSGYHSLLDNIPVTHLRSLYHIGKDYFPIEKTQAKDINWIESGVLVTNVDQMNDDVVFSFTFWYY